MKQQHAPRTIFSFFGPPGSGKGTLAQKLVNNLGFQVLSTGNLCRKHVAMGSEFGKMLDQYLQSGKLIPDELITDMVIDWLESQSNSHEPVILDGFPRTQGQAAKFLEFLKKSPNRYLFDVIVIEIPDDEIVKRLAMRVMCSNKNCQVPFTDSQKLTNCPVCSSPLTKRNDDREDVVRERLAQYPAYRDALLGFYRGVGQKIDKIDIATLSPDQVYEEFLALIGNKS